MSESKNEKLSASIKDAKLKKSVEELEKENEALKAVNAEQDNSASKPKKLSEKERTYDAEITVGEGKNKQTKKVKALLLDVPKLYISGVKYSPEEFLKDKKLRQQAVDMRHKAIKIQ